MRAAVFEKAHTLLVVKDIPAAAPGPGQIGVRVSACGVCRTDLHIVDGELTEPKLPLVPGHQIVGTVADIGEGASGFSVGQRVGIPWLGYACGTCSFCTSGRENLCARARFTGYDIDGGYAEHAVADARFCFPLPAGYSDLQVAPLLCGGLIGYRALRMAGSEARRIGFYGFGSAAHILTQVCRHQGREVYAFTRPGDVSAASLALRLGASWAGDSQQKPPVPLDAAILFAPDGALVPLALRAVERGGSVICAGIHMSDIPSFPYDILWEERTIRSVANLTRMDAREFLALAPQVPVRTEVEVFPLDAVNEALARLRTGKIVGSAVIDLAGR
ncbi:MAG TPA: zinc-dependent alcohol dehydrogenase family protein [Spirochaetia bacterium]|nr:zinc-dependent alcohol dehydrogenase family protein [Spirochaetia bacterium]